MIWASIKFLHHRPYGMENLHKKNQTHRSIVLFSTIQHARHLEFDHVPTTRLRIEIVEMVEDRPIAQNLVLRWQTMRQ